MEVFSMFDGNFEVGSLVTWQSQASGTTTRKTGEIVAVVPPKTRSFLLAGMVNSLAGRYSVSAVQRQIKASHLKEDWSYLVAVQVEGKKKKCLYWPRTSMLQMKDHQDSLTKETSDGEGEQESSEEGKSSSETCEAGAPS